MVSYILYTYYVIDDMLTVQYEEIHNSFRTRNEVWAFRQTLCYLDIIFQATQR